MNKSETPNLPECYIEKLQSYTQGKFYMKHGGNFTDVNDVDAFIYASQKSKFDDEKAVEMSKPFREVKAEEIRELFA